MAERARLVARFLFEHGVWHSPDVLVTIGDFVVWDIGMRMLVPRELAGAQGFPVTYDITAGGRLTETAQRHKIGNSVCPPIAEAIVRANCIEALSLPNVRRRLAPLPARLAPRLAPPVGLFDGVAA
jgi:DNA (cytosine-5)-methyltransferase 1